MYRLQIKQITDKEFYLFGGSALNASTTETGWTTARNNKITDTNKTLFETIEFRNREQNIFSVEKTNLELEFLVQKLEVEILVSSFVDEEFMMVQLKEIPFSQNVTIPEFSFNHVDDFVYQTPEFDAEQQKIKLSFLNIGYENSYQNYETVLTNAYGNFLDSDFQAMQWDDQAGQPYVWLPNQIYSFDSTEVMNFLTILDQETNDVVKEISLFLPHTPNAVTFDPEQTSGHNGLNSVWSVETESNHEPFEEYNYYFYVTNQFLNQTNVDKTRTFEPELSWEHEAQQPIQDKFISGNEYVLHVETHYTATQYLDYWRGCYIAPSNVSSITKEVILNIQE